MTKKSEIVKSNIPVSDKDKIEHAADFASCRREIPLLSRPN